MNFSTIAYLNDPSLKNLGNFHVNDNDEVTIYWIGLGQITLPGSAAIEIEFEDIHGIAL